MTHVYIEQDGDRYTICAKGHATGSTEMCAAVSALLYTLAGWLRNSDTETITARLDPGDACLMFRGAADAQTAFDLMTVGFLQLAASSPELISAETEIIS